MSSLRRSGFYVESECIPELAEGASLLSARRGAAPETSTIADYLDGGAVLSQALGWTTDHFDSNVLLPLDLLTDGSWIWPAFAGHYCRTHGILPAPELTAIALAALGRCPVLSEAERVRIAHDFFESQYDERSDDVFRENGR